MRFTKERHELLFRIQSSIYDRDILRKQLTAKSFIVDIRPGSKYPCDERNKLFSFQIKATLKATTIGIRMCTTELLLWKNRKSSTCYPISLFKRDSTADIFLQIFNFFGQAILKNSSQPLIVKGFYLLRMSNDYSSHGIPEKWNLGPRTLSCKPKVGAQGGDLMWNIKVGSQHEALR